MGCAAGACIAGVEGVAPRVVLAVTPGLAAAAAADGKGMLPSSPQLALPLAVVVKGLGEACDAGDTPAANGSSIGTVPAAGGAGADIP